MATAEDLDESALLAAVSRGDSAAFVALYRRHSATVFRMAWTVSPDRDAVPELVQDTFFTLWQKAGKVRTTGSVLPWLLVTCRNHARNRARKDRQWHTGVPLGEYDAADGRLESREELRWIHEALATLSDTDRRLCELCFVEGHSYESAAKIVGLTPGAVGKRLQRARLNLRRELS